LFSQIGFLPGRTKPIWKNKANCDALGWFVLPNLSAGVPAPGTHENRRCEAILVRMLYPATFVGTRIAVRVSRMRCSVERVARNGAPLIRDPGFFFLFPVCGSQAASTQSRLTRLCALKMPISGKLEIGVCSAPFASLMLRCARDTLVGFFCHFGFVPPPAASPSLRRLHSTRRSRGGSFARVMTTPFCSRTTGAKRREALGCSGTRKSTR